MGLRGFLLGTPSALLGIALLSVFWVPRASDPGRRNDAYVFAERGDARRLDPLLSGDYVSARIVDQIFEGLVRRNEASEFVGALAERWEDREVAYLAAQPDQRLANGELATGENLLERLEQAQAQGEFGELAARMRKLERTAPTAVRLKHTLELRSPEGRPKTEPVQIEIRHGERIRFELDRVVSDLDGALERVLGGAWVRGSLRPAQVSLLESDPKAPKADLERELYSEKTLAALAPIVEHHPVTRFHLRKNVRFHDGHPLTSKDVLFSYEAAVEPVNASPLAAYFEPVEKVDVLDDFTFEVTYKRLFSSALLAWDMIGIVPEHRLNQTALGQEPGARVLQPGERRSQRDSSFQKQPIGTGPFRFGKWQGDEFLELVRFGDYWGKKPEFEKFVLRTIPDETAQEFELHAGSLDRFVAKPHQATRLRDDPRYQALYRDEGHYSYIGYNFRRPLFRDRRVRRALGMAIDVEDLVRYVMQGEARRTTGPYYVNTPHYDPSVPPLPYDPKGAEGLLTEAGYTKNSQGTFEKDGKELTFEVVTSAGNGEREAIATIAQDAWRKIGVRAELRFLDWAVLMDQRVNRGDFDVLVLGWVGGDVTADKYAIWHSSQTDPYELNFVGFQHPEADRILEDIQKEYDPARQIALAHELHRLLADEQPYTFLHARRETWVFAGKLREVRQDERGQVTLSPLRSAPSGEADYFLPFWTKAGHPWPAP